MKLPESSQDFFINRGLYEKFNALGTSPKVIEEITIGNCRLDAYCPQCRKQSIFVPKDSGGGPRISAPVQRQPISSDTFIDRKLEFVCSYISAHVLQFQVRVERGNVFKTGQYPSLREVMLHDFNKYITMLGDAGEDLKSAHILHANGYSVGAFTYVRRVFEYLVDRAEADAIANVDWKKLNGGKLENNLPMPKRIEILEEFLPQKIVEKAKFYNLLSDGVHKLSDEECANLYAVAEAGIRLILDDQIARKQKAEDEKLLDNALSKAGKQVE